MKPPVALFVSVGLSAALIGTYVAVAGPLDPPAGAVASTLKTLGEVEPRIAISPANTPGDANSLFKITQPGSYYLTGNLTGVAAKHGIEIDATGVSLDLNGFHLIGTPGSLAGIRIDNIALVGITITNGTVRAWGSTGVDLNAIGTSAFRLDGISSFQNGLDGFVLGTFGSATNCHAFGNASNGFRGGAGSSISHCTARQNTDAGFNLSSTVTVSHCIASQNDAVGTSASVAHCVAQNNGGEGYFIGTGSTITYSVAFSNTLDGIRASSAALIAFNLCQSNGNGAAVGAGIHVSGSDNRIQNNNCLNAEMGIDADQGGNIVAGNTCSGNTANFFLAPSNYYGAIIDRTAVITPAVNGPAAAGTLTSTDPHANFSY